MKLEKLAPWNWFKMEEEQDGSTLPVQRSSSPALHSEPLRAMHDEIDRVFGSFARSFGFPSLGLGRELGSGLAMPWLRPSLDLSATEKEYSVTVEIPGVDKDDVSIELDGNTLVVRGEKKQRKEESKGNYYRMERSYGSFQRTLSLPQDSDGEAIDARFEKGLLVVRIPRKPATGGTSRSIEIRNG